MKLPHHKKGENTEQNFWISYADLMAGLLFVFILIMTGIILKLMVVEKDADKLKNELSSTALSLTQKDELLEKLKKELALKGTIITNLESEKNDFVSKNSLLIADLNKSESEKEEMRNQITLLLSDLNLSKEEAKTINLNLIASQEEFKKLLEAMKKIESEYLEVSNELNTTKTKIKQLTGLKVQVITKLKEKLGSGVSIDPKSGALRLSSNIFFEQNGFVLKDDAKKAINTSVKKYLDALMNDEEIKKHIEYIMIEGHTNTDGTYLHNLELSQKRAYAVMEHILQSDINKNGKLEKYLISGGRSYADLILDKNGKEDKEASRRIEIKFNLKNEDAIREIEKILENSKKGK